MFAAAWAPLRSRWPCAIGLLALLSLASSGRTGGLTTPALPSDFFTTACTSANHSIPLRMSALVPLSASFSGPSAGKWNLALRRLPIPCPTPFTALIRVAGSSVNPSDWKRARFARNFDGSSQAGKPIGTDVSGTIVALGSICGSLAVGNEVWGMALGGAYAEYALIPCHLAARIPASSPMSLVDYGTLAVGALTSLDALLRAGAPWTAEQNITVAVTSGAGGTGVFAIQEAIALGAARVVTQASPSHAAALRELGASLVVDYHTSSLWDELPPDSIDVVYDTYGGKGTAARAAACMRSGSVYSFVLGGEMYGVFSPTSAERKLLAQAGARYMDYGLLNASPQMMKTLEQMIAAGQVKAVTSKVYPMAEMGQAFSENAAGHVLGKLGIVPS